MTHISFNENIDQLKIAILIKESAMNEYELLKHYIEPTKIDKARFIAFSLKWDTEKKVKASTIKEYLKTLLPALKDLGIQYLYVADAEYFKVLTKKRKAEPYYSLPLPCVIPGYEDMTVILVPNYKALFYNPSLQKKIDLGTQTLQSLLKGSYTKIGSDVIHSASYPNTIKEIQEWLNKLLKKPALTCDIETTGLRVYKAKLGTIAFAWDEHNGIAFPIHKMYIGEEQEKEVHKLLKQFFEQYEGTLIFHNALFDVKILIAELFMEHSTDYRGMNYGLKVFESVDDSQILSYLAQNSTEDISLSLKDNAFEFIADYALDDIKDITKVSLDGLLKYNLLDTLATWFVTKKYQKKVIEDKQVEVYQTIFQPSIKPLLKMMLIGLPINLNQVDKVEQQLQEIRQQALNTLRSSPIIAQFNREQQLWAMIKKNLSLKKKQKTIEDFKDLVFNPGSVNQKQILIYEMMGYEPIDFTDTGAPATGSKTLEKLKNRAKSKEDEAIFEALITLTKVEKILSSFTSNFKTMAVKKSDGYYWLTGNLKLGGTQSGRLSSSDPNLQNIPSGSTYAKLVKSCFVAPDGWLFAGADFSALEDRIGALLSKDPNKMKEFSQGIDGHSLRCLAFFSQLPEPVKVKSTLIDPEKLKKYDINDVKSVNLVKPELPEYRQEAKAPSFALQYGGTWHTLVNNIGLSKEVAQAIEKGYHELYKGLAEFSKKNIEFANKHGYVECAFGLRLRTPILHRCILNTKSTPYEAMKEGRSASNAVTQSWGMLMNRALIELEQRLEGSGFEEKILACNTIHDAAYFVIKDEPEVIKWLNDNLIECMQWNEHPLIKSDEIPMEAELDIGKSWADMITLPNNLSIEEIKRYRKKLKKEKQ